MNPGGSSFSDHTTQIKRRATMAYIQGFLLFCEAIKEFMFVLAAILDRSLLAGVYNEGILKGRTRLGAVGSYQESGR